MTRPGVAVAALALLTLPIAACGSGSSAPTTTTTVAGSGTPLDQAQALELSSVLYKDYQAGGALVTAAVPYQSGTNVTIEGEIDFRHHEGHLTVTTVIAGQGTSVENIDYTATTVYEQGGPAVAAELAQSGHAGQTWVGRPADPKNRPLDKIIQILVSLASPARDNPLLVQESHARYDGPVTVAGVRTDSFQYDPAITYFVDPASGVLRQFVASVQGFAADVTIDITDPGPRNLPPPDPSTVLEIPATTTTTSPAG